jgi:NADH-quinone oxidoreductase subunit C
MTEENVNGEEKKEEKEEQEEKIEINFDDNPIVKALKSRFSDDILETYCYSDKTDELTVKVRKEKIKEICQFVKESPELEFTYLADLTGVDYPERDERFDLVYHLYAVNTNQRLRLRISFKENEAVDSVVSVWQGVNYYEREAYDMLGIKFTGHPDLKRILMPDGWEGHPYRKDYPLEDQKTPKQRLKRERP